VDVSDAFSTITPHSTQEQHLLLSSKSLAKQPATLWIESDASGENAMAKYWQPYVAVSLHGLQLSDAYIHAATGRLLHAKRLSCSSSSSQGLLLALLSHVYNIPLTQHAYLVCVLFTCHLRFISLQYGEAAYWDERYTREPTCFDWYQNYTGLEPILKQHLPTSALILHVRNADPPASSA
jgi:hypothetical protein